MKTFFLISRPRCVFSPESVLKFHLSMLIVCFCVFFCMWLFLYVSCVGLWLWHLLVIITFLTHLYRIYFPICINWTSRFPNLGWLDAIFHFYSNSLRNFCKQSVENLIRHRVLRRLIWFCTVCRCPTKRTLGLYRKNSRKNSWNLAFQQWTIAKCDNVTQRFNKGNQTFLKLK